MLETGPTEAEPTDDLRAILHDSLGEALTAFAQMRREEGAQLALVLQGQIAQIADLVLERRCHRAVFFEDPHVARQHEADIQLLERAVTTVTDEAVCTTSLAVARRWCEAVTRRRLAVVGAT